MSPLDKSRIIAVNVSSEPGILTPEQGAARTAVLQFCERLEFGIRDCGEDVALSEEARSASTRMLESNPEVLRAEGMALFDAWESTGGHEKAPTPVLREHLTGMFIQLARKQECYRERMAYRAKIAGLPPANPPPEITPQTPEEASA